MNISRRRFLSLVSGCVLVSAADRMTGPVLFGAPDQTAKPAPKRNVLFIAVDDLRPQLGCYGNKTVRSPNIDKLASRSLVFDNAYCQQAVCAPSRASILSGARPDTTKIYNLETPLRSVMPDVRTLPEHFKLNGYETLSIGKIYHHGNDDARAWTVPPYRATGDWKGRGYLNPESIAGIKSTQKDKSAKDGLGPAFESADVPDNAYPDGKNADYAIEQLRHFKKENKPFFMAMGFLKPHLPFVAPRKYWDLYKPEDLKLADNPFAPENAPPFALADFGELRSYAGMPAKGPVPDDQARQLIHGYHAALSYMDSQVGRLLDELDRLGLRDNTVVILWGDHGWKLGDHGSWCKHSNFEIDTHVPLLLSVPAMKSAGRHTDALVEFVDMYPSLCQACGLDIPVHLEGLGMMPLDENPQRPWKIAAFSQYPRGSLMGYTLRTREFRYTEWNDKTGVVVARELYDHRTGHAENANLADKPEYADMLKRGREIMAMGFQGVRSRVNLG